MTTRRRFDTHETARGLRESLSTVDWAASNVPERWSHDIPEWKAADEWSVAMNLAHLVVYEERIVLPVLEALAAGGDGAGATSDEDWFLNESIELSREALGAMLGRLKRTRLQQIEIVEAYDPERFNVPVTSLWSSGRHAAVLHSAGWVATKTLQHTWEHGNAILQVVLFGPPSAGHLI